MFLIALNYSISATNLLFLVELRLMKCIALRANVRTFIKTRYSLLVTRYYMRRTMRLCEQITLTCPNLTSYGYTKYLTKLEQ